MSSSPTKTSLQVTSDSQTPKKPKLILKFTPPKRLDDDEYADEPVYSDDENDEGPKAVKPIINNLAYKIEGSALVKLGSGPYTLADVETLFDFVCDFRGNDYCTLSQTFFDNHVSEFQAIGYDKIYPQKLYDAQRALLKFTHEIYFNQHPNGKNVKEKEKARWAPDLARLVYEHSEQAATYILDPNQEAIFKRCIGNFDSWVADLTALRLQLEGPVVFNYPSGITTSNVWIGNQPNKYQPQSSWAKRTMRDHIPKCYFPGDIMETETEPVVEPVVETPTRTQFRTPTRTPSRTASRHPAFATSPRKSDNNGSYNGLLSTIETLTAENGALNTTVNGLRHQITMQGLGGNENGRGGGSDSTECQECENKDYELVDLEETLLGVRKENVTLKKESVALKKEIRDLKRASRGK